MSLIYVDPRSNGKLFQAGKAEIPDSVREDNISILLLGAWECPPRSYSKDIIENLVVFYIPLDDADSLTAEELDNIKRVARYSAMAIRKGYNVLSTCHQGRNRSGLLSAFILKYLTNCKGKQAIRQIKNNRQNALTNNFFQKVIILDDYNHLMPSFKS